VLRHCQETIMSQTLHRTPLFDRHAALGARLVPFAGYEMPVQYPTGILAEHNWTRSHAGLFDVSHMGQAVLQGPDFEETARVLEKIVPADVLGLATLQQRYTQLLNADGGILDDMMVARSAQDGDIHIVVNASRKAEDFAWMAARLPAHVVLTARDELALLALQGPEAEAVLAAHEAKVSALIFMQSAALNIAGIKVHASRSGYTGEDGFELSVAAKDAAALWDVLLTDARVKAIGLGARDSLRLEGGLCLYGHDIDDTTSPIEADLAWSIAKRRRLEGGFIGAARVQRELAEGVSRKRVGIKPEGKAPAREGTVVQDVSGRVIGNITSGGFGPTVNGPVAMGYVEVASAVPETPVHLVVRDKALPASVVKLPFVPNRFKR
jgi:aminomethyltransferase